MKNRFIPLEKRSKKQQKDYHSGHRKTWGSLNPVTRKPDNPKVYNRKTKRHSVDDDSMSFLIIPDSLSLFPVCHYQIYRCFPLYIQS